MGMQRGRRADTQSRWSPSWRGRWASYAAPAVAEEPTVTVTPSVVSDGQQVTMTTAGFPSGLHAFLQCPASFANIGDTYILDKSALLSGIYDRVPDATFEAPVSSTFSVADQSHTVDCNVEPGGCIVGVKVLLTRVARWRGGHR